MGFPAVGERCAPAGFASIVGLALRPGRIRFRRRERRCPGCPGRGKPRPSGTKPYPPRGTGCHAAPSGGRRALVGQHGPHVQSPLWLAEMASPLGPLYFRLSHATPRWTPYAMATLARNSVFSHTRATRGLGHTPRALSETLPDTVAWLMENADRFGSRRSAASGAMMLRQPSPLPSRRRAGRAGPATTPVYGPPIACRLRPQRRI
jgi:hypothetical protein